ncbi:MAG: hypothetical protein J6K85_00380 [Clostridia bacterium]|nr:hypothetical protein [Clostridia bacterium]
MDTSNKNRYLSIIVGIFLAIVLGLGGVFAVSLGIKNARAVVKYEKITIDEETLNYLCAYYKAMYIDELKAENIDASDTQQFWSDNTQYGITYGEHFRAQFRMYVASLAAAANHYSNHSLYTPDDKLTVTVTCDNVLTNEAQGDVSIFNSIGKKYGFNYNDFQNAAALIYKAQRAEECTEIDVDLIVGDVRFGGKFNDIDFLAIPALENFIVFR